MNKNEWFELSVLFLLIEEKNNQQSKLQTKQATSSRQLTLYVPREPDICATGSHDRKWLSQSWPLYPCWAWDTVSRQVPCKGGPKSEKMKGEERSVRQRWKCTCINACIHREPRQKNANKNDFLPCWFNGTYGILVQGCCCTGVDSSQWYPLGGAQEYRTNSAIALVRSFYNLLERTLKRCW